MKIFLCAVIVFISGYIGLVVKNEYTKKVCFLQEFIALLQYLSVKTAFFKDTLADNIYNYINANKPKNTKFFNNLASLVQSCNLSQTEFVKLINLDFTEDEKHQLYLSISGIVSADILSVNKLIEGSILSLNGIYNKYQTNKKQKGDVFSKLMIAVGLLVCIIIY